MSFDTELSKAKELIDDAQSIVVIQGDNPDADSLASSLALEHIFENSGKKVVMYCGVDMPSYLHYIPGYDRVTSELPNVFDASVIVDCSTVTLLEKLEQNKRLGGIAKKPVLVIDHHPTASDLPFTHQLLSQPTAVSTGEIIFALAQALQVSVDKPLASLLVISIMADSLGLTTENVTSSAVRVVADLIDKGADLSQLDAQRRASMTKPLSIIAYKAQLLQRIEFAADNRLAVVHIPWKEIEQYSSLYNPGVLALEDLRFAEGVLVSVALKSYPDGKITGKIRCNYGSTVAGDLAAHFGGGGHKSAAGFKTFGWKLEELKNELIKQATLLLNAAEKP